MKMYQVYILNADGTTQYTNVYTANRKFADDYAASMTSLGYCAVVETVEK